MLMGKKKWAIQKNQITVKLFQNSFFQIIKTTKLKTYSLFANLSSSKVVEVDDGKEDDIFAVNFASGVDVAAVRFTSGVDV